MGIPNRAARGGLIMDIRRMLVHVHIASDHHAISLPVGVSRSLINEAFGDIKPCLGRDLVELLWVRRWVPTMPLWQLYGILDPVPGFDLESGEYRDTDLPRRVYAQVASIALAWLLGSGIRDRNGTHFRWASGLIDELRTHAGRRASTTWRANATESRYPEFRDYCEPTYALALEQIQEAEDAAIREIESVIRRGGVKRFPSIF